MTPTIEEQLQRIRALSEFDQIPVANWIESTMGIVIGEDSEDAALVFSGATFQSDKDRAIILGLCEVIKKQHSALWLYKRSHQYWAEDSLEQKNTFAVITETTAMLAKILEGSK